jgi:hypothetical protein
VFRKSKHGFASPSIMMVMKEHMLSSLFSAYNYPRVILSKNNNKKS